MTTPDLLKKLARTYREAEIEFPDLKAITLAQWILETGWDPSELARQHNNFGGLKFRSEMSSIATKIRYEASDGADYYCAFRSVEDFIEGYWIFIDRSPYRGWRDVSGDPERFIEFVGPIYAPQNRAYSESVLSLLARAEDLLDGEAGDSPVCDEKGPDEAVKDLTLSEKPGIKQFIQARYFDKGRSQDISRIVIHYTTAGTASSTINEFTKVKGPGETKTSSHYLIDKNGDIYQLVKDGDTAYHAKGGNANSIGIEHVARPGDAITVEQSKSSIRLLNWLRATYDVPLAGIVPHKCIKNTSCCGDLFEKYGAGADDNCKSQKKAIDAWLAENGVSFNGVA